MEWIALTAVPATFAAIAVVLHLSAMLEERVVHAPVRQATDDARSAAASALADR